MDEFLDGSWRVFSGDGHYKVELSSLQEIARRVVGPGGLNRQIVVLAEQVLRPADE